MYTVLIMLAPDKALQSAPEHHVAAGTGVSGRKVIGAACPAP